MLEKLSFKKSDLVDVYKAAMNDFVMAIVINDNDEEKLEKIKMDLRGWLHDIIDGLNYVRFVVPIIVVVISSKRLNQWQEVAGDQDWHRGEFALIVCRTKKEANNLYKGILQESLVIRDNQIQPLNNERLVQFLKEEVQNLQRKDESEEDLYKTLINHICDNIQSFGDGSQDPLSEWKKYTISKIEGLLEGGVEDE